MNLINDGVLDLLFDFFVEVSLISTLLAWECAVTGVLKVLLDAEDLHFFVSDLNRHASSRCVVQPEELHAVEGSTIWACVKLVFSHVGLEPSVEGHVKWELRFKHLVLDFEHDLDPESSVCVSVQDEVHNVVEFGLVVLVRLFNDDFQRVG